MKYFIGLLHEPVRPIDGPTGLGLVNDDGSQSGKASSTDRVYLEDFRVALKVPLIYLSFIPFSCRILLSTSGPLSNRNSNL